MCRIVSEEEFSKAILIALIGDAFKNWMPGCGPQCVTGPGRSGAIAAVYASHILGIPFIPYGAKPPPQLPRLPRCINQQQTGKTMRKAQRKYEGHVVTTVVVYNEPPRVAFWYEAAKPQLYQHERTKLWHEKNSEAPLKIQVRGSTTGPSPTAGRLKEHAGTT